MFRRFLALFSHRPSRQRPAARHRARPCVESLEMRDLPTCLISSNTCFGVIGDYGNAGQEEADVATLVKSWNADFIVTTGDNNYNNGAASTIDENIGQYYHDFIYPYTGTYGAGSSTKRFWPALGNHDWESPNAQPYLDYFALPGNERYYSFTRSKVEFFVIDSDDHEPDGNLSTSKQANWLKGQLAASTSPWKIVYFHHPPYSSGSIHGSTAELRWPFQAWGADAVLTGHDHIYERLVIDGFPYFVNGLGGDEIYPIGTPLPGSQVLYNNDFGAMLVDASSTQINFQFITRTGQVIDSYTITKGISLPTVTIAATDSSAAEPGTNTGKFTVTRTGSTTASLTVTYTVGGTATAGADYTALSGSVTIPAAATTATILVTPKDDTMDEPSEKVIAALSSNSAYTIGTSNSATVYIADNDPSTLPIVTIAATDSSAAEPGTNTGRFTVTRTGSTTSSLTVKYTVAGTASAGADYTALSGSVTLPAGTATATITVTPKDDSLDERSENVIATLSSNSAYTFGTPTSATIYIADNDSKVTTLIPFGTGWRYLDNGSNQGTSWRGASFVDSAWHWGKAQFGYGDGDEDTVLGYGADPNNKYVTTYFRHTFSVSNPSLYANLTVHLVRDDGAVVYLNGTQVFASNMPSGTITYTTLAASAAAGSDETTAFQMTFGADLLRSGSNVIAVEVHQWDRASPDLSFDLELIASA